MRGLLFREEQVGYLVGYLAALVARSATAWPTISAVGGFKEPPVDRFIAGYRAGAEAAVPGTKVLTATRRTGTTRRSARSSRLDQIARGSQVVFQVAGGCGLGALVGAKDRRRLGDRRRRRPVVPRPAHPHERDQGRRRCRVFLTIQSVIDGTFAGGDNTVFGLDQEGVGLGTISDRVPQDDLEAVDDVERADRRRRGHPISPLQVSR